MNPEKLSFNEALKKAAPSLEKREMIKKTIRDNFRMLESCEGPHEFIKRIGSNNVIKFRCNKCTGIVDRVAYKWYTQGLEHAKKN